MGIAAYNRGTKAIKDQFDREFTERMRKTPMPFRGTVSAPAPEPKTDKITDLRRWMRNNRDEYETATELAEAAFAEFRNYGGDDETVFEWAAKIFYPEDCQ